MIARLPDFKTHRSRAINLAFRLLAPLRRYNRVHRCSRMSPICSPTLTPPLIVNHTHGSRLRNERWRAVRGRALRPHSPDGFVAWFAWLFIHLMLLIGFRNRVLVLVN